MSASVLRVRHVVAVGDVSPDPPFRRARLSVIDRNADDAEIAADEQCTLVSGEMDPARKATDEPAGDDAFRRFVEGEYVTAQEIVEIHALSHSIVGARAHPRPEEPAFLDPTGIVVDPVEQAEVGDRRIDGTAALVPVASPAHGESIEERRVPVDEVSKAERLAADGR